MGSKPNLTNLILGSHIHPTSYSTVIARINDWAKTAESRYVCAANVHMVMEAYDHQEFRRVVNSADLVTPDGMPLVWILRARGDKNQERVYGPTLMLKVLENAESESIPVGFYGGKLEVLDTLVVNMKSLYPHLNVVYTHSPSFGEITDVDDHTTIKQMTASGVRILFVGLGCPKQETWMYAHRGQVNAVMIGVGAAFDFYAGSVKQAPHWMQRSGLEWLFRFSREPARLWKRYVLLNPRFVILSLVEQIRFWIGKNH
jgi:N-acetylglucosaminyldiphosphoundecaprenol N-acetyl-beta-D-mannosaminyltransferase